MFEFLRKFFDKKDDNGNAIGVTFDEFVSAVSADKDVKLYNLSDGGYVSIDKLNAKIAELNGVKTQLENANLEIQSYKDMDIAGIKASAEKWKEKYKEDTKALEDKLRDQEYEFQVKELASGLSFSSASAKKAFISDLMDSKLTVKDGTILGFDDFVAKYREGDPGAFVQEQPADPEPPKPQFSAQNNNPSKKKPSLQELMRQANEGRDVSTFFG